MNKLGRAAVLLLATFALIAAGCGGDDDSSDATTPPAAATDAASTDAASTDAAAPAADVSDADVAAGLAQMVTVAAQVATTTATDAEAGKTAAEGLEPHWAPIEDRVKANDPDAYIAIEDAMAQLESGDATKAAEGAAALTTAITTYVAAHPGDAAAAATTAAVGATGEIAAGLEQMVTVAAEVATTTATDAEAGKTAAEGLEPHWAPIEDRVKANDPDAYIAIEDAMAQLESGDATKAAAGATAITTAIAAYVAAFPG